MAETARNLRVWGELGDALPNRDPHGVSVHLPTWKATQGWASRDPELVDRMKTGYPRFYYHRLVVELTDHVRQIIDKSACSSFPDPVAGSEYSAMLFPCLRHAYMFTDYLRIQNVQNNLQSGPECYFLSLQRGKNIEAASMSTRPVNWENLEIAAVVFAASKENLVLAKQFWQHAGYGICSRYAEICLKEVQSFYVQRLPNSFENAVSKDHPSPDSGVEMVSEDEDLVHVRLSNATTKVSLEGEPKSERIAASIRVKDGQEAKRTLRRRLATLNASPSLEVPESDVIVYPTGMTAITEVAGALRSIQQASSAPMVVFGFLYVDTFKTLERIHGWTTKLYGRASTAELDELDAYLSSGNPISGLILEVPGNPLLSSPDLIRLRNLANQHHFPIIIDDTVGTPVNVDVMQFADVVASSLTKMFSGACNVMGGALILNHTKPFYTQLRDTLQAHFIDSYFPVDAEIMAHNSADFAARVLQASENADMVAYLIKRSPAVETVFYPKGSNTQGLYDSYRRPEGGYGYLLSINFYVSAAAVAFFDALQTAKGPSLGTNFTLCCPYTLYAHYSELEWAAEYGVGEYLVRISVGLEEAGQLEKTVQVALQAAEAATWQSESR